MPNATVLDTSQASLTILKASAGSGKTFSMARKYLALLLRDRDYFRHILAVTFTNKATAELKERVLGELDKLASGKKSDHLDYLVEQLELDKTRIRYKAKGVLEKLLQDYSNFHIYTIDGFFQYVLKGFFREIGLQDQYNIELNQDQILEQATNLVFFQLAENNNADLIKWLTRYSETEIASGKNWNLKGKLMELGKELFSEQFKNINGEQTNLKNTLADLNKLQQHIHLRNQQFEEGVQNLTGKFLEGVKNAGLTKDDFKGKSRSVVAMMERLQKTASELKEIPNLAKYIDNVDELATQKAANRAEIESVYFSLLNALLKDLLQFMESKFPEYIVNRMVSKQLYSLGVIHYVQGAVREINNEQNSILISDSNALLSKIIGTTDASFIYEKTGTKFWNFMIDEFQDTSRMQWNNLLPLVDNSMALGNTNLIVGDVKQAIYRWRNSDWKMLGGEIANDFSGKDFVVDALPKNYRSAKNVVDFNNAFFHQAHKALEQEWANEESALGEWISIAYENCYQEPNNQEDGGFVKGQFIAAETVTDYREKSLEYFVQQLQELLDAGYEQSDICVLVRKNAEGKTLIDYAKAELGEQVQFVSEESYFLSSSFVVQVIVSILRYLKNNTPLLLNEIQFLMQAHPKINQGLFLEDWMLFNLEKLKQGMFSKSLTNLVHDIILAFELEDITGQQAFLFALLDEMKGLQERSRHGVEEFLEFWDNSGAKLVLKNAQSGNAIRILTIHKSKGLEFNVVLMPFVEWDLESVGLMAPILWTENDITKTDNLKALPVKYVKEMAQTRLSDLYYQEKVQSHIDNLNLLYVAFTRAKQGLYFNAFTKITQRPATRISSTSSLIRVVMDTASFPSEHTLITLPEYFEAEAAQFTLGNVEAPGKEKTKPGKPPMFTIVLQEPPQGIRIKQKANREKDDSGTVEKGTQKSGMRMGVLLHDIFEKLESITDWELALDKAFALDAFAESWKTEVKDKLRRQFAQADIQAWFADDNEVLRETSLLTAKGELLRPDRIVRTTDKITVIDYKFGEVKADAHRHQVKYYMEVLQQIYALPVKGYLWYVMREEVVVV